MPGLTGSIQHNILSQSSPVASQVLHAAITDGRSQDQDRTHRPPRRRRSHRRSTDPSAVGGGRLLRAESHPVGSGARSHCPAQVILFQLAAS